LNKTCLATKSLFFAHQSLVEYTFHHNNIRMINQSTMRTAAFFSSSRNLGNNHNRTTTMATNKTMDRWESFRSVRSFLLLAVALVVVVKIIISSPVWIVSSKPSSTSDHDDHTHYNYDTPWPLQLRHPHHRYHYLRRRTLVCIGNEETHDASNPNYAALRPCPPRRRLLEQHEEVKSSDILSNHAKSSAGSNDETLQVRTPATF